MTLERLAKFTIEFERVADPGRPPELAWLSIKSLRNNTTYQRPVTTGGLNTIKRIMANFSWSRFSPVIVRRVPGSEEIYEIIDGQHRSTAALNCGYDKVPAMIVRCSDAEAARIFAAVNGNVTPMQALSVYKAALAGNEQWAVECKAAAEAAGCSILTRPTPYREQKPLQTNSIQSIKRVWSTHGPKVLEATFRLIAASRESETKGFLTSFLILHWGRILGSRPGWVRNIDRVVTALRVMAVNVALIDPADLEFRISERIGDGRKGDALDDIKAKVVELYDRRLSTNIIATQLRLPYAEVERIVREIKGEKLLLERPR